MPLDRRVVLVAALGLLGLAALVWRLGFPGNPLLTAMFWETATARDPALVETLRDADLGVRDREGRTPLHYAATYTQDPEVIRLLVRLGADVNARDRKGRTPLHEAVGRLDPRAEIIRALVQAGADVNARDEEGQTPLHLAVLMGSLLFPETEAVLADQGETERGAFLKAIATLVYLGADVNARDASGMAPLHWAAVSSSNAEIVKVLGYLGADVNARDGRSWTPLHHASLFSRNPIVVLTLLELGADPKLRDPHGITPWDLIQANDALRGTEAYLVLERRRR